MADHSTTPRFGEELKDGFKGVNVWVFNGISWLEDLQQFYRERAIIEKEYSSKLNALAKKHFEKKNKRSSGLGVGDTPALTPGSLESASVTTWTTHLTLLESQAAEHDRFSGELQTRVADPMKNLATRLEDIRKSHTEYAMQLEKERETSYSDLRKTKVKYDGACQEVESRRKRTESTHDQAKNKAQNAFQQQLSEMRNVKNSYLINLQVTNKSKEKYYHQFVPELLDSLQDLAEVRVNQLNSLWSAANNFELSMLARNNDHLGKLRTEIPRNEPYLDSLMYAKHNKVHWQEPPDLGFEPSPLWHDDNLMAIDDMAKIYLRNLLGRSKLQLKESKPEFEKKKQEIRDVRRLQQRVRAGTEQRDEVDIVKGLFSLQEGAHKLEWERHVPDIESQTIIAVVGDISAGAMNHKFKSETFKIPTNCDLCGERIWGLSAKGFDCQDCGYTCHSKCELKVPPSCPGETTKEDRKRLKVERQAASKTSQLSTGGDSSDQAAELPDLSRTRTMDTLSSGHSAGARRSINGTHHSDDVALEKDGNTIHNVVRSMTSGRKKTVAPPPDQYPPQNTVISPQAGFNRNEARARMLYPYRATADGECDAEENEIVSIIEPDDGSGWTSVRARDMTGVVPTAYFELIPDSKTVTSSERPISSFTTASSASSIPLTTAPRASAIKKQGPAVAPRRGAKKVKYVQALYDYEARTDAEFSMRENERFVCVTRDTGDGWADVEKGGVVKSVPANYVQDV